MSIIRKEQLSNPLSASYALTASYAENANVSINTSSFVTTSSFNAYTASINAFTASYNTGSFSGSFTGSLLGTASYATNANSASYALTASFAENVTVIINTSSLVTTSSFNAYTASINSFTSSINTFTASYNTGSFTGSFTGSLLGTSSWAVSASQAVSSSYYQETDPVFVAKSASLATTGSNTFTGTRIITGSNGKLIYTGTTSGVGSNPTLAEVHANDDFPWLHRFYNDTFSTSSAVMAYYGWNDGRFVFHNESTQSIGLQVNGFNAENGLLVYEDKVAFVNNVEVTGSLNVVGGITGSLQGTATTASYYQETDPVFVAKSASLATTGSNTFIGNQIVTGSLVVTNNLTVLGSASIQYISESTLNIGTNLITVNTNTPSIRFGGLAVIDSGSSPITSASFLYDSVQDEFIFAHKGDGTNITSSHFILGPETYNDQGNEIYLTANRIPKGVGNEHLNDSNISDNGSLVSINSDTNITGSLFVLNGISSSFTGSLLGTASSAISSSFATTASLATSASFSISSSYAVTASYVLNSTSNNSIKNINDGNAVTGTTSISQSLSVLIPANTFTTGDVFRYTMRAKKTGANGITTVRAYVNTANNLTGALQLSIASSTSAGHLFAQHKRIAVIKSSTNTETLVSTGNSPSDDVSISNFGSTNINWATDQWFILAISNASAADSTIGSVIIIEII